MSNIWKHFDTRLTFLFYYKVDFEQGDGTVVRNIVAEGAGGPEDLYMTYVFQYHYADIQPGSNEYNEKLKGLNAVSTLNAFWKNHGGSKLTRL